MRTALLPTPGDPFVLAYWLRNLERIWIDEIDRLDVLVNGQRDPEVIQAVSRAVSDLRGLNVQLTFTPERIGHGEAIRELVLRQDPGETDVVMLVEDDAFVRDSSAVGSAFCRVALGDVDVIATPRGGMDPAIQAAAEARWPSYVSQCGSTGPGMWPCFLFAMIETLRETSCQFEARTWRPGDTIPGLDYLVQDREQTTDCCTAIALELRGRDLRIEPGPQYKELWQKNLPKGGAPWFHAGGLSNADLLSGAWDGGGARPGIGGTNEGLDWAHRIWWWRRCLDTSGDLLSSRQGEYRARLHQLTARLGVQAELEAWSEQLLPWINWDDRA